jgi:hypothetical protein
MNVGTNKGSCQGFKIGSINRVSDLFCMVYEVLRCVIAFGNKRCQPVQKPPVSGGSSSRKKLSTTSFFF